MDARTRDRLDTYRQALERNPNDRTVVLEATRLLREIGQAEIGSELLGSYLKSNAGDAEASALASELGIKGWTAVPRQAEARAQRAPSDFSEISHHLDTVSGWILKEQEKYLFDKVKSLPDGAVIVEMGCCKGKSTVAMAFACVGTRKRVYSIDTYVGNEGQMGKIEDFQEEWTGNLRRFGLEQYATPLRGYTFDIVPDRSRYPAPDFVFIDASHEFTDVLEDFRTVYPYVKDGGWISFHDVEAGWPGPWRVWKDYAKDLLAEHEICSTLACGRKVAGRPFRRRADAPPGFSFAGELIKEYSQRHGSDHALVRAMEASLSGLVGTREQREALFKAEMRLAEAPEKEFHAVLNDFILARDGRIDGHVRLWSGLSLLGQGRFQEALDHFHAMQRVSLPLPADRAHSFVEYIRNQKPGLSPSAKPAVVAALPDLSAHVRDTDKVIAVGGGDGSLLGSLPCAYKVGMEADRESRKHSITEFGVDSLESWADLPDGFADVVISADGISRDASPLSALKSAYLKLRPGGTAVVIVGASSNPANPSIAGKPALYSWTRETLGNLLKEAGFHVRSVDSLEGGIQHLKAVAWKP